MKANLEEAYHTGGQDAWTQVLAVALQNLGGKAREKESWRMERQQAVSTLRSLCAEFGDNDWPDDLNLADVLDKHLRKHLEQ